MGFTSKALSVEAARDCWALHGQDGSTLEHVSDLALEVLTELGFLLLRL